MIKNNIRIFVMILYFLIITSSCLYAKDNYSVGSAYYNSLADAVKSITSEGTIKVLENCDDVSSFVVEESQNVVLDTNGKTIELSKNYIKNNGFLEIKGSGTIETNLGTLIQNKGNLVINDATLKTKGNNQNGNWYTIYSLNGTVVVNSGKIFAGGEEGKTDNLGRAIGIKGETVLTINGGEVKSNLGSAITSISSSAGTAGKEINVEGGSIISLKESGIQIVSGGGTEVKTILNMNGGKIKAEKSGISIGTKTKSNVTITRGEIISNSTTGINHKSGSLTIGDSEEPVSITNPIITGNDAGITSTSSFNFFDGILKGGTEAYSGKIDKVPSNYEIKVTEDSNMKTAILNDPTKIEPPTIPDEEEPDSNLNPNTSSYSDTIKAFQEVAWAFYQKGKLIQYNSSRTNSTINHFAPEYVTEQSRAYLVCSGLPRNVYYELFGFSIPPFTANLISYARTTNKKLYDSKKEVVFQTSTPKLGVVAFGAVDKNNNLVMTFYDGKEPVKKDVTEYSDILPHLKIGDVLTYTGHAVMIYDLIKDDNGNTIDALMIESAHVGGRSYINTKTRKWKQCI